MAREGLEIEGLDEVIRRLKAVGTKADQKAAEKVLLKGSRMIASAVRRKAKGSIKKAVKAKTGKRKGRAMATSFTAIDRKIAPHAHLVEYGHALVKGGQVVGHVPAHPFWRPAVDSTKAPAQKAVEDGIRDLLKGAIE